MNKYNNLCVISQRRRLLVAGAAWPALAWAGVLRAQSKNTAEKPVRVAILSEESSAGSPGSRKMFIERMRELGWVEGRNVTYDLVQAHGDGARLTAIAKEMVARRPDIIVVRNTQPALAAAASSSTIPIVFGGVTNPDQRGLVKSLRQPGANVTGTTSMGGALGGKRLQLLKEAIPKITKVGVLVNTSYSPTSSEDFRLMEQAAKVLGVSIVSAVVDDAKSLDAAFAQFAQNRVEAVLTTQNPQIGRERGRVLELAARQRIPVVATTESWVTGGALMGYSASLLEEIHTAARMVDKILKGAKPADIPVEQSSRFHLVVNMKTAKTLGISIPQSILIQTDRVIE